MVSIARLSQHDVIQLHASYFQKDGDDATKPINDNNSYLLRFESGNVKVENEIAAYQISNHDECIVFTSWSVIKFEEEKSPNKQHFGLRKIKVFFCIGQLVLPRYQHLFNITDDITCWLLPYQTNTDNIKIQPSLDMAEQFLSLKPGKREDNDKHSPSYSNTHKIVIMTKLRATNNRILHSTEAKSKTHVRQQR